MSRRLPSSHRRLASTAAAAPIIDNNPYQVTTYQQPPPSNNNPYNNIHHYQLRQSVATNRNKQINNGQQNHLTDATLTDSNSCSQTYYECYYPKETAGAARASSEHTYSEDSGSTRLPHYDYETDSCKRFSRNTHNSDRSFNNRKTNHHHHPSTIIVPSSHNNLIVKDMRRVYPNQYGFYPETTTPSGDNVAVPSVPSNPPPRRLPVSSQSDRPQSSMSSGVTSAIVDGCGGKCQTFENICYFFLQLVFMMGILIGVSLCIAGLVLRKSAARNLQVLVYIGILLATVSSVLLGIQWNARSTAKRRKLAKRTPIIIPLDTLGVQRGANHHAITLQQQQQQPLMVVQSSSNNSQRVVPVHHGKVFCSLERQQQLNVEPTTLIEQQGVPWWRRKDLPNRL